VVDEVDEELAALRRAYGRDLPAKARAVSEALAKDDRGTAALLAHRLRGTAGSYGFAEVSVAAGSIEDALGRNEPTTSVQRECELLVGVAEAAAK